MPQKCVTAKEPAHSTDVRNRCLSKMESLHFPSPHLAVKRHLNQGWYMSPQHSMMNGLNHSNPNLSELHGDIVLELLGGFGPGLLIPALQAAGKLLQDAHIAGCGGSCGSGGRAGSKHLALRFFGEKLPLIF